MALVESRGAMSVEGDLFFDCYYVFPTVQLLTRKKKVNTVGGLLTRVLQGVVCV